MNIYIYIFLIVYCFCRNSNKQNYNKVIDLDKFKTVLKRLNLKVDYLDNLQKTKKIKKEEISSPYLHKLLFAF